MLSHHLVPKKTVAKKIKQFVTPSHPKDKINLEGALAQRLEKSVKIEKNIKFKKRI